MKVISDQNYHLPSSVVALGMFDGLHLGHRVLLRKARVLADEANEPLVVCTFSEHPLATVAPDRCPPMLTNFSERCELMEQLGVDILYTLPFDRTVMNMPPEEYVGRLVRHFHPVHVVCGYNHSFGKGGEGSPALLTALGAALGFRTTVVPKITYEGAEVSSTAVRRCILEGRVREARLLLERPYSVRTERNADAYCFTEKEKPLPPEGYYRVLCGKRPAVVQLSKQKIVLTPEPEAESFQMAFLTKLPAGRIRF